ncbi:hypothetical protein C900_01676 [Fulvivirga imtechensis AK7]|uniref:Uncharacterized protein n=1 Tax=Fulvivirga imtechensis AK7 TaxID=1237149 RepID=L8JXN8_9BACT|nr:hypothetical protein C900_01676 [Fulvivirga imtechensis AK7]
MRFLTIASHSWQFLKKEKGSKHFSKTQTALSSAGGGGQRPEVVNFPKLARV